MTDTQKALEDLNSKYLGEGGGSASSNELIADIHELLNIANTLASALQGEVDDSQIMDILSSYVMEPKATRAKNLLEKLRPYLRTAQPTITPCGVDQEALSAVKKKLKSNHDVGHLWIEEYEAARKPTITPDVVEDLCSAAQECAHQLREAIMHITCAWRKEDFKGESILTEMEQAITAVQNALLKQSETEQTRQKEKQRWI